MLSFIFSGQGSHYYGMGSDLYENNETFSNTIDRYSKFYQDITGINLVDHLYSKKETRSFNDVLVTHPAIVITELAMVSVMNHYGVKPACVIGSSVGELAGLVAADMMDQATAVTAAFNQAFAISNYAPKGGMTAVIEERSPYIDQLIDECELYLAADNFPGHFTVSGLPANLETFERALASQRISFQRLEIDFAFHSPLIDSAEHAFLTACQHIVITAPNKAIHYFSPSKGDFLRKSNDASYLWRAVRSYSDLNQSLMTVMASLGITQFIDLGPSGTMSAFINNNKQIKSLFPQLKVNSILSRFKGDEKRLSAVVNHEFLSG